MSSVSGPDRVGAGRLWVVWVLRKQMGPPRPLYVGKVNTYSSRRLLWKWDDVIFKELRDNYFFILLLGRKNGGICIVR